MKYTFSSVYHLYKVYFKCTEFLQGHVQSVGGVLAVSIDKPLLLSAAGARQNYWSYLDEQKRKKTSEGVELKRKELVDELEELKKKRRRLDTDVDNLVKSAESLHRKQRTLGNLCGLQSQIVWGELQKKRRWLAKTLSAKLRMLWMN